MPAQRLVQQRLQTTSRLTEVSTVYQPCSRGMSMRQAKVLALEMQKTFSRTAGHQTEQRLKYFLFLQSWKKKTPTVKRYTLFPKLIWSFQRRSVWYWKSPIVPNEPWHFRDTSAVTAPPWEAGLRCAPRQCSILRSVILAPTCSRG